MASVGSYYAPFRPDKWSAQINRYFYKKLVMKPLCWDLSPEVMSGGKTIIVPSTSETFSAQTINATTGTISATVISDTVIRLDIDKWRGAARQITDAQLAQIGSMYDKNFGIYQEDMAQVLAKEFDKDLITLAYSLTLRTGDSTSIINDTNIREAIRIAETSSIPLDAMAFVLHPGAYWGGPMVYEKFYSASVFGQPVVPVGYHDLIYGLPVLLTTRVGTDKDSTSGQSGGGKSGSRNSGWTNFLVHNKAFSYAFGNLPGAAPGSVRVTTERVSGEKYWKTIADVFYGVKLIAGGRGVKIYSTTQ